LYTGKKKDLHNQIAIINHVCYRDIKPHNILMDKDGHVHLADFNIATYLHNHRPLTSNSGTGYYMGKKLQKVKKESVS
jgi:serine/threonine kinase 32